MSNVNELNNRINARYSSMSKGQKMLANYITDTMTRQFFSRRPVWGDCRCQRIHGVRFAIVPGYKDIWIFRRRWRRWCATS